MHAASWRWVRTRLPAAAACRSGAEGRTLMLDKSESCHSDATEGCIRRAIMKPAR